MPFGRVREAHTIPDRPPIKLAVGDEVTVGERDTSGWPAFVFVTARQGGGWVPARYLSSQRGRATVITAYDTTELPTTPGEVVTVLEDDAESGWLWCRAADGREGWVPSRIVDWAETQEPR